MKKIFVLLLTVSLCAGMCACKSRTGAAAGEATQKGARENVVISENPKTEENMAVSASEESGATEPEDTPGDITAAAEDFLEAVKTGSKEQIQQHIDFNALLRISQEQNAEWQFKQILPHVTYEIISAKIDGDAAAASIKISNVDMGVILPLWFEQAMRLEYDNALLPEPLSRDGLDAKLKDIFAEMLNERPAGRVESLVDIRFKKDAGVWKPQNSDELGDALLGRYFSAYSGMAGNMMQSAEPSPEYASGEAELELYESEPEE